MITFVLIYTAFIIILINFYLRYKKTYSYWRNRNIIHETPWPVIGNHGHKIFGMKTNAEIGMLLSQKYPNEDFVGYYRGNTPELYVKNPKFYKNILNSDFDHFYIRGVERDSKKERMLLNLYNCSGDYWRLLRHRLAPAFTNHKLTKMFPLIVTCAEKLQLAATDTALDGKIVDAFDMMARYTMECICSSGFGMDTNIISEEKSLFLLLGKKIFTRKAWQARLVALLEAVPSLGYLLQPILKSISIDPKVKQTLIYLVSDLRQKRSYKPSDRHDFIDLLIELEALGKMKGESFERKNPDGTPVEVELEMDVEVLAAQVYIFFAAGFSTTAMATSTTLHYLAFNPDVQDRILKHVDKIFSKYDNKISYESIAEMRLLEMAIKEAMRLFPPSGPMARICTKKYTFPGTDISIDPGVRVVIPTQALYYDEKYYTNPTEYRPERFLPDEISRRPKYTYLVFGEGQRKCIGNRIGTMVSMAGVAAILQRFSVEPASTSNRELKINRNVFHVQYVDGGIPIKLVPRTDMCI